MNIRIFLVTLLSILLVPFAFGVEKKMQDTAVFKNLDTDKNGFISLFEARGKHRVFYYYPLADKNSDGQISKLEFKAFVSKK